MLCRVCIWQGALLSRSIKPSHELVRTNVRDSYEYQSTRPRFSCAVAPPRNAQIHRVYSCVLWLAGRVAAGRVAGALSFTCCWGLTVVQSLAEFRTCTEQIQIFEPTVFRIGTRSLRRVVCEQLTDVPQCGVLNSCCWCLSVLCMSHVMNGCEVRVSNISNKHFLFV
jgi:hypothetical protein